MQLVLLLSSFISLASTSLAINHNVPHPSHKFSISHTWTILIYFHVSLGRWVQLLVFLSKPSSWTTHYGVFTHPLLTFTFLLFFISWSYILLTRQHYLLYNKRLKCDSINLPFNLFEIFYHMAPNTLVATLHMSHSTWIRCNTFSSISLLLWITDSKFLYLFVCATSSPTLT